MKLYHGSNMRVTAPDLSFSKPFKDFGQGFYLSADEQQAKEQALSKVNQMKVGVPVVNEFLFDESLMTSDELKVKVFCGYSVEWAEFVLMNRDRNIAQPSHDYDVVYGPIADDGVNYQLRRYWGGVITLPGLIEELKYAKGITFQYFFGTERALKTLKVL
ncbi:MAG: DUF3990 domain-containing protein [Paludibacteraceae bacterium]|nr:DUF3990 domain-containing protein [Paludibacteraceae bacterium]